MIIIPLWLQTSIASQPSPSPGRQLSSVVFCISDKEGRAGRAELGTKYAGSDVVWPIRSAHTDNFRCRNNKNKINIYHLTCLLSSVNIGALSLTILRCLQVREASCAYYVVSLSQAGKYWYKWGYNTWWATNTLFIAADSLWLCWTLPTWYHYGEWTVFCIMDGTC